MRRFKPKNELEDVNLLGVVPVRLAEWTEDGDRLIVTRPKPIRTGLAGMIDNLLCQLSAKRIRLDSVGSSAWLELDGTKTVGEVAQLLRARYGDRVEPAEERLGHLVRVFRREGLVAYRGWDDELIARGAASGSSP